MYLCVLCMHVGVDVYVCICHPHAQDLPSLAVSILRRSHQNTGLLLQPPPLGFQLVHLIKHEPSGQVLLLHPGQFIQLQSCMIIMQKYAKIVRNQSIVHSCHPVPAPGRFANALSGFCPAQPGPIHSVSDDFWHRKSQSLDIAPQWHPWPLLGHRFVRGFGLFP